MLQEQKQPLSALLAGKDKHKTISALVVAKDPGLAKFITQRFPRLRKVRYSPSGVHCANTYTVNGLSPAIIDA